jgi:hypothetical protein
VWCAAATQNLSEGSPGALQTPAIARQDCRKGSRPAERVQCQLEALPAVGRRLETVLQVVTMSLQVVQRRRTASVLQASGHHTGMQPIRLHAETQCSAAGTACGSATEAAAAASEGA